jgi:hypothetical protein
MVVYGGIVDQGSLQQNTWQLSLDLDPRWSLDPLPGSPGILAGHSAIFDPVRNRMLIFGGYDGAQNQARVWAMSLSDGSWAELLPSGGPPPARRYHSAIYDPLRDRMVIFGGQGEVGSAGDLDDVWSLWLSPTPRWEQMFPTGPGPVPRRSHTAIYDPLRDRMLVFGGSPDAPLNDLWALSLVNESWTLLGTSGTPPSRRSAHTAIYDPVADRMVVFGGSNGNQDLDDVWLLSLANPVPDWSRAIASPSPGARVFHSAIYDSVHRRMVVFGGPDVSEPTWALSLAASFRWSPLRPSIEVSPTELLPTTVTVGDTVPTPFVVSNGGMQPLDVASFEVPSDARVSPATPGRLLWNATREETLSIVATTPGLHQDSLVIVSNDPVTPRRRVGLQVLVRGLEFDTHVLGNPDSVAPGVSFIVVVTPRIGVRVERGQLFYRVANTSSPFDSLSLTPLATDFIGVIPAAAVTESGVEYYAKVENSGFSATQPAGAPTVFSTQSVSAPEAITAVVPRPSSGSDFLAGQDIPIDVVLPDGAIFDSGTLWFRRGGETDAQSLPLAPSGTPGQVSTTIPDSVVGPRGVEYWVDVRTLRSTLRYPAAGGFAPLRIKVPNLSEPQAHSGGRYRLFTVPLDFGADFTGTMDALLTDQLGTYDKTRWRAFAYDASVGNVELTSGDVTRFRPHPGRAFWLISKGGHRVDTKPVAGLSTSTAGDYVIPLVAGWNLIGNPYDFPVAWADVVRDGSSVEDPVRFDPSRGTIGDYATSAPTVLLPFEGYFLFSSRADTLRVPPREAPLAVVQEPALGPRAASDAMAWELSIEARTDAALDASAVFGIRPNAKAGFDLLDRRRPPSAPGPWVRVAFPHADWDDRSGLFLRDLRAPSAEGETWEVEVTSGVVGEAITLDLRAIVPAPSGVVLGLVDREQGTKLRHAFSSEAGIVEDLRHQIVSFGSRPYRLQIVVGTAEYVRQATDVTGGPPARVVLDASAPNPFRFATRLRFSLPKSGHVRLEIFGVKGDRVATLLERRMEAGIHAGRLGWAAFERRAAPERCLSRASRSWKRGSHGADRPGAIGEAALIDGCLLFFMLLSGHAP